MPNTKVGLCILPTTAHASSLEVREAVHYTQALEPDDLLEMDAAVRAQKREAGQAEEDPVWEWSVRSTVAVFAYLALLNGSSESANSFFSAQVHILVVLEQAGRALVADTLAARLSGERCDGLRCSRSRRSRVSDRFCWARRLPPLEDRE